MSSFRAGDGELKYGTRSIKAQAEFGKTSLAAAWAELRRQGDNISLLIPMDSE